MVIYISGGPICLNHCLSYRIRCRLKLLIQEDLVQPSHIPSLQIPSPETPLDKGNDSLPPEKKQPKYNYSGIRALHSYKLMRPMPRPPLQLPRQLPQQASKQTPHNRRPIVSKKPSLPIHREAPSAPPVQKRLRGRRSEAERLVEDNLTPYDTVGLVGECTWRREKSKRDRTWDIVNAYLEEQEENKRKHISMEEEDDDYSEPDSSDRESGGEVEWKRAAEGGTGQKVRHIPLKLRA